VSGRLRPVGLQKVRIETSVRPCGRPIRARRQATRV